MTDPTTPAPVEGAEWKLAPVEPTEAMIAAAWIARGALEPSALPGRVARTLYTAMLAASPPPLVQGIEPETRALTAAERAWGTEAAIAAVTGQGSEAEELDDDDLNEIHSRMIANGTVSSRELGSLIRLARRALSRLSPLIAGEGAHVTHKDACAYAEHSTDPLATMLRDADERLNREPPDVHGAKVSLHGARLGQAHRALATQSPDLAGKGEV